MADKKISALTSASTPLAGTEVLPIVQSGATVKVAVSDLTAGRAVSASTVTTTGTITSGSYLSVQKSGTTYAYVGSAGDIVSGGANADMALSTPGVNNMVFAIANNEKWRLDTTGNLVVKDSGNGIDFSATPGTGTSELLADYEEGTWTPTDASGAGLTFTSASGRYTKIGNVVCLFGFVQYPATASGANASIGGLPFTCNAAISSQQGAVTYSQVATVRSIGVNASSTNTTVYTLAGGVVTNVTLSATVLYFNSTYFV
jgi:hypothetical protein